MVLTREQYTRSGEATIILPDTRKPRGSTRTKMGSEDDKGPKLTYANKFTKLELHIQELTNTLAAFMKESTAKSKPKKKNEAENTTGETEDDEEILTEEEDN
ncbi:hypothetical protein MKX03_020270, partial [Papaver bracteatum]